jgi:3-hydroxyisobutyrate dehydrogenase-like beta-hydroxyacid dehydrogenase
MNIGFIGLGVMGSAMVRQLLQKGHTVIGYNRTESKAKELTEAGMVCADSPRAVCATADITLAMVTDSKALENIAEGPDGILAGTGAGKLFSDMSTVSPAAS